ncbi:MAG: hypothetical protein AVDCRST_MAG24-1742, partial [uncultured Nocardioidaceae bacterium]
EQRLRAGGDRLARGSPHVARRAPRDEPRLLDGHVQEGQRTSPALGGDRPRAPLLRVDRLQGAAGRRGPHLPARHAPASRERMVAGEQGAPRGAAGRGPDASRRAGSRRAGQGRRQLDPARRRRDPRRARRPPGGARRRAAGPDRLGHVPALGSPGAAGVDHLGQARADAGPAGRAHRERGGCRPAGQPAETARRPV